MCLPDVPSFETCWTCKCVITVLLILFCAFVPSQRPQLSAASTLVAHQFPSSPQQRLSHDESRRLGAQRCSQNRSLNEKRHASNLSCNNHGREKHTHKMKPEGNHRPLPWVLEQGAKVATLQVMTFSDSWSAGDFYDITIFPWMKQTSANTTSILSFRPHWWIRGHITRTALFFVQFFGAVFSIGCLTEGFCLE